MNISISFIVSVVSGLYTSLWGAFKDSPFEGFKRKTFPRSIYFHIAIFIFLYYIPDFRDKFESLSLIQLFFFIMGIERLSAEFYKGFFRNENQEKYFVPSRITFLGKYIDSNALRYSAGVILFAGAFSLLYLDIKIESFFEFLIVAYCAGLVGAFGGAYKDAPFEGFKPLKFQRTPIVLAVVSPVFYFLGPMSLGFLIYMNWGMERFIVEYYKTYIQRTMSGKFRPDLTRIQKYVDTREKYHYAALVIILGLILLYIYEIRNL